MDDDIIFYDRQSPFVEPVIIYEDKQIIAVHKPDGWLAQPDSSSRPDVCKWLKAYLRKKWKKAGGAFLGLCHRLDRQASGIMVFAKTSKAAERICQQFRERTVKKYYQILCSGLPTLDQGCLYYPMVRDEGKRITRAALPGEKGRPALLEWDLKNHGRIGGKDASLVEVKLITGVKHQIRAQFAEMDMPIIGDVRYGGLASPHWTEAIGLYAKSITLAHPTTHEIMTFEGVRGKRWPWWDQYVVD